MTEAITKREAWNALSPEAQGFIRSGFESGMVSGCAIRTSDGIYTTEGIDPEVLRERPIVPRVQGMKEING